VRHASGWLSAEVETGGVPRELRLREFGTLRGTVVEPETKAPVPACWVNLLSEDFPPGNRADLRTPGGRLEWRALFAGRVRCVVGASGHLNAEVDLGRVREGEDRGGLHVELGRSLDLAGVVVDAETGRPVPGARVELRADRRFLFVTWMVSRFYAPPTGPEGRFRLQGLRAGRTTLRGDAPGYASLERDLALDAATPPDEVRLELRRAAETV
jgi:hypothetical protein